MRWGFIISSRRRRLRISEHSQWNVLQKRLAFFLKLMKHVRAISRHIDSMFASELITLIVLNWGRSIEDIVRVECENQFGCVESMLGRWFGVSLQILHATTRTTQTTHNYDNSSKFRDFKLFMRRHGRWLSATPASLFETPSSNQTSAVLAYDRQVTASPPSAEVVFRLKQINYTWNMPATQERDTWVQLVWKNVISWIPPVLFPPTEVATDTTTLTR